MHIPLKRNAFCYHLRSHKIYLKGILGPPGALAAIAHLNFHRPLTKEALLQRYFTELAVLIGQFKMLRTLRVDYGNLRDGLYLMSWSTASIARAQKTMNKYITFAKRQIKEKGCSGGLESMRVIGLPQYGGMTLRYVTNFTKMMRPEGSITLEAFVGWGLGLGSLTAWRIEHGSNDWEVKKI